MSCLQNGKQRQKYSESIRQFCIALNYYSPNAYNYVRSVFGNNLPHFRTLRAWLYTVDASPGITSSSLKTLERMVNDKPGEQLLVSLMKDEIYIRKNIEYLEEIEKFEGFEAIRNSRDNELMKKLAIAKRILVYMVVGKDFKLPVAYYPINGLNAQGAAALTQVVIENINKTGAKVISLTQDGPRENIKMAKKLGADFENEKPYFPSPTNPNDKIYVILDPAHMIKLFRGCLYHHKLYSAGKPMHWEYISRLYELQRKRNFNLGNKLTAMHIDYKAKPMDVRIACETLSHSTANGIDICRNDGYTGFEDSETTTEFIRHVKNSFNILNYKPGTKTNGKNFKKPLNPDTVDEIFEYCAKAKEFFKSIEIDVISKSKKKKQCIVRKSVLLSQSFTPFFGLVHNMTAIEGLYRDHVLNGPLDELHLFQMSQDHLETFFAAIRIGLGDIIFPK